MTVGGGCWVIDWLVPGMVPHMDEAEDGPVREGLGLEAQVVGEVLWGKVDSSLAVHDKYEAVQRFQHQGACKSKNCCSEK